MPTTAPGRLLIVDDEPLQMKALCDTLESEGYTVAGFTSARMALAALREELFDVLLTDLMMPEANGITFLAEALETDPNLVGIVMTGHGAIDTAVQAMQAGALDYVIKPFKLSAILPVIARALSVRRLRMENIQLHQAVGIYELSMAVASALDTQGVAEKAVEVAWTQSRARGASVLLLSDDGRELRTVAWRGDNRDDAQGRPVQMNAALGEWVAGAREALAAPDESSDLQSALAAPFPDDSDRVSIPLLAAGRFLGILTITREYPPRPLAAGQVKALSVLANAAASALETAMLLERLRSAEQRYRRLAEQAPDIVYRYDLAPQPRFVYVNPAVTAVTGYTPEEHYADAGIPLKIIHPDDRESLEAVLEGGYPSGSTVTLRFVHRNGSVIWIEQRIMLMRDSDDRLVAIEGVARDITERRQLEEQLRQAQKMEAIGRLAGGVAHDFNNLLTIINGFSDLILNDYQLATPIREKVTQVRKAGEHAAALTRQLLSFSRRQVVQPTILCINTLVESNSKILRRIIGEDIELAIRLDPELDSVKADASQIEQILMNLAVNARDAMPQGGNLAIETRNVTVDEGEPPEGFSGKPGNYVMLAVGDNGCGMDAATQARIFDPFFTTKEIGRGTGLGLSIVYGVVKQSEGEISVSSEPGKGATFRIYLPCTRETEAPSRAIAKPAGIVEGSETILVVEDDAGVRQLITTVLKTGGYEVLSARGGDEALQICREYGASIGMVLTDLVMPHMSGPVLLEHLRNMNPRVVVLFMSGYADDTVVRHGHLDPGIPFIQKPFSAAKLLAKVREVLDRNTTKDAAMSASGDFLSI